MTLRRRSLLVGGRNSPKSSPRRCTAQAINRRTMQQTVKHLTKSVGDAGTLSGVSFGAASKANLKVVVRVRPFNKKETESNARSVVEIVDEHMLIFDPKHEQDLFFYQGVKQRRRDITKKQHKDQKFLFEAIFGPESTNQDIFENTTKDILDTLLEGYNCSVFAYGATGAGKTFTMLGRPECPGITLLTLMELYARIAAKEERCSNTTIEVVVSYLEVYNEMVRDLLEPGKPLQVQDCAQQVMVPGLSHHKPRDAEHLMELLELGNCNRSQHPTDANAESSRSHAVFQVMVKQHDRSSGGCKNNVSLSKLSMIDLAGSERACSTGCEGQRFREGANINRSLLALGNCINALADGKSHVPYRDSKLTRLLKDSLGGNCRSVMVAAVSAASTTFEDTFNTLRYSNRAKTIKTTLKKNQMSVENHVSQYVKIVEVLKEEILQTKAKLEQSEAREAEQARQAEQYEETIAELRMQLKEACVNNNNSDICSNCSGEMTQEHQQRNSQEQAFDSGTACAPASTSIHVDNIGGASLEPSPQIEDSSRRAFSEEYNDGFSTTACSLQLATETAVNLPSEGLEDNVSPEASSVIVTAGSAVENLSSVELALQDKLRSAYAQVAGLHREVLELAGYERKLELELYISCHRNSRINLIAFADYKLRKSVDKLSRSKSNLEEKLSQTRGRCSVVGSKLLAAQQHCQQLQLSLLESYSQSLSTRRLIEQADTHSVVRQLEGSCCSLQQLMSESAAMLQESFSSHSLALQTVRAQYVRLHSTSQHTPETQELFQRVVSELDECKISWAEPPTTKHSDCSDATDDQQQQDSVPQLDIKWLTSLADLNDLQQQQHKTSGGALGQQLFMPKTMCKSIMKGSISMVDLKDCCTSPMSIHDISSSTAELRQFTLTNTLNNKRLSLMPHLPSTQFPPSVQAELPLISISANTTDGVGLDYTTQRPPTPSAITINTNTSIADSSTVPVRLCNISNHNAKTVHAISTSSIIANSVSSTVENLTPLSGSTSVSCSMPADSVSDLKSTVLSSVAAVVSLEDFDENSSPVLETRPLNPTRVPTTPQHAAFPSLTIEETSPPPLPTNINTLTSGYNFSVSTAIDGRIYPTCTLSTTLRQEQLSNFNADTVATTTFPESISNSTKKMNMQRQSGTRNLITSFPRPNLIENSFTRGDSIHDSLMNVNNGLTSSMLIPMSNDVPLPVSIIKPGSRSAIYSAEMFSLSPAVNRSSAQNTDVDITKVIEELSAFCGTNIIADNNNSGTNHNLNVTIDIPAASSGSNNYLNTTIDLNSKSAPTSRIKPVNIVSKYLPSKLNNGTTGNDLNSTYITNSAGACGDEEEKDETTKSGGETDIARPDAKQSTSRHLDFSSHRLTKTQSLCNLPDSTFLIEPSEQGASIADGGLNPMALLESSIQTTAVIGASTKNTNIGLPPQPKPKGILKNITSSLNMESSNGNNSSATKGIMRFGGSSNSHKNPQRLDCVKNTPGSSASSLRRSYSSRVVGNTPDDKTGAAMMRRALLFKTRRINRNQENKSRLSRSVSSAAGTAQLIATAAAAADGATAAADKQQQKRSYFSSSSCSNLSALAGTINSKCIMTPDTKSDGKLLPPPPLEQTPVTANNSNNARSMKAWRP
uniref:Kinesin-like protein KIF18A n=1 Tax=Hirondellea gigas TaxID=1518452 RepID=A0A6A7FXA6_9CRUS